MLKLICARNSRPESMRCSRRKTSSMSRLIYYSPPGDVRDHSSPAPKRCRIILLLIGDYFLVALCKTPRKERDILNGFVGRQNLGIRTSKQSCS